MMIDAEMYGMMPRAKIAMRPMAPPANMLNMPIRPLDWELNAWASASGLMPGSGM